MRKHEKTQKEMEKENCEMGKKLEEELWMEQYEKVSEGYRKGGLLEI